MFCFRITMEISKTSFYLLSFVAQRLMGRCWPPGTSWVGTSRSLLISYPLAGRLLAGWLAGFIHFAIDLLLSWFKNKPKQNEKDKKRVPGGGGTFKKNDKKLIKKVPKKPSSLAKTEVLHKNVFFYSKIPPSLPKTEVLHEKLETVLLMVFWNLCSRPPTSPNF